VAPLSAVIVINIAPAQETAISARINQRVGMAAEKNILIIKQAIALVELVPHQL
jgi:hypothetical protein